MVTKLFVVNYAGHTRNGVNARSDILIAILMKYLVFLDVKTCRLVDTNVSVERSASIFRVKGSKKGGVESFLGLFIPAGGGATLLRRDSKYLPVDTADHVKDGNLQLSGCSEGSPCTDL
jgi:hypothetical protein